jgi:hypothetical protein
MLPFGVEATAEGLVAEAGVVGEAARVANDVVHLLFGEVGRQFEHPRLPVQVVHNIGRLELVLGRAVVVDRHSGRR